MKSPHLLRFLASALAITLLAVLGTDPARAQVRLPEAPYSADDLAKPEVLAAWHFDGDGTDASGKELDLKLRGKDSQFTAEGKFGGALQIEERAAIEDSRQGAALPNGKSVNPEGAFTVEMWISPSEQLAGKRFAFLVDSKNLYYIRDTPKANQGFLLTLAGTKGSEFTIFAGLGFGTDSSFVQSRPLALEAGEWYHLAFTYDGKGLCTFYCNAAKVGETQLENRGALAPSSQPLVIGDRIGSLGHRFLGKIDELRILNQAVRFASDQVLLSTDQTRTSFYRQEPKAALELEVFNDTFKPLENATLKLKMADKEQSVPIPTLIEGEKILLSVPIDASLRPGSYPVEVAIEATAASQSIGPRAQSSLTCTLVPRPLPHQMPIILWGTASIHPTSTYQDLLDIGYMAEIATTANYSHIWKTRDGKSLPDDNVILTRKKMDEMMALGLGNLGKVNVSSTVGRNSMDYYRSKRDGSSPTYGRAELPNLNTARPEVQQFGYDIGAATARTFGDLPNLQGILLESEGRDQSYPSFTEFDQKAYRNFSGKDIPDEVDLPQGVKYQNLPNFPEDRVVKDDDPILQYYRWFWTKGDGWNDMNSRLHAGLVSTGRTDILDWVDPAVRVPSIWGSGGEANMINQWTYTYPNPIVAELATNELFAMADGRPGQKVMNMIQIIWKRWEVTNAKRGENDAIISPTKEEDQKEWEKVTPNAPYISIAPDHISEATWLELTHPVSAIANHGWGSLGDELGFQQGSYYTTNVDSRKRMAEIFQTVVKPLAPTLLQVTERPTEVAFLESFTSQIFAGTGTYGWGRGWGADSYIIARYAGFQPKIVYEDHLLRGDLDRYKVLFLTDCPVLPESIVQIVKKYQAAGGIVIGDETLTPAITPDHQIAKMIRSQPDEYKAKMQGQAAELAKAFAPSLQALVQSDNPDLITALRRRGSAQYLFAINDHRSYGDYLGQYKKVMEKGMPTKAQITLRDQATGYVYDLSRHQQVAAGEKGGKLSFPVSLDAAEGRLLLVTEKAIGKLQVTAPASAERGSQAIVEISLPDEAGAILDAVIPMTITLRDAVGKTAEGSGYYGATDGKIKLTLDIASNDAIGDWQIEVTEAATGQKEIVKMSVK